MTVEAQSGLWAGYPSAINQNGATEARTMRTGSYTAKDITILTPQEVVSRFEWAHIGALAAEHHRPAEWIERGFRACQHVGVPVDYFVERYLEGKPVARREDVDAAFRELFAKGRG